MLRFASCALLVIILAAVNACGIKPSTVQPPENVQEDKFPRTYPAPELNQK